MAAKFESSTISWGTDLDFLIVGKTGNGKSSTGNSILGVERFSTSCSVSSETTNCDLGRGHVGERTITVMDTPGLCDTRMEDQESQNQTMAALDDALRLWPDGFHAILVVLRFGDRMTMENVGALRDLETMLGGNMLRDHGIIVMTGGDSFAARTKGKMTFEEWCGKQEGAMRSILDACHHRCVLFDNVTEDEETLNRQRSRLIELTDGPASGGRRYTSQVFEAARDGWRKAKAEGKTPDVARDVYMELGEVYTDLNQAIRENRIRDKSTLDNLRSRLDEIDAMISQLNSRERARLIQSIDSLKQELDNLENPQLDVVPRNDLNNRFNEMFEKLFFQLLIPVIMNNLPALIDGIIKKFIRSLNRR